MPQPFITDSMRFVPAGLPATVTFHVPSQKSNWWCSSAEQLVRFDAAGGGFCAGGVWAFDATVVATVRSNTNSARVMEASARILCRPRGGVAGRSPHSGHRLPWRRQPWYGPLTSPQPHFGIGVPGAIAFSSDAELITARREP